MPEAAARDEPGGDRGARARYAGAVSAASTIYSVGHSTRSLDELLGLLEPHGVRTLVDVRRHPGSRKYPHFGQEPLREALAARGIDYVWLEALGGRRARKDAGAPAASGPEPNAGLRNASFRRYADYMQTGTFHQAVDELLELTERGPAALLCAEAVFWRCHRRLIADHLLARGVVVQHILGPREPRPHPLTPGGVLVPGGVVYPGGGPDED